MMIFFKKYWTHIVNILFLVLVTLFFYFLYTKGREGFNNSSYSMSIFLGIVVFTILVFVEIIVGIIKIGNIKELSSGKKTVMCLLCWFLNVFYIPCAYIKHIYKDKNYVIKNIIYLLISLSLFGCMYFYALKSSFDNLNKVDSSVTTYLDYNTFEKNFNVKIPSNYQLNKDRTDFLSLSSKYAYLNIFEDDDVYEYQTVDDYLDVLIGAYKDKLVLTYKDSFVEKKDGKIIRTFIYDNIEDGEEAILTISLICFDDDDNNCLVVVSLVDKKYYEDKKQEIMNIVYSAKVNN